MKERAYCFYYCEIAVEKTQVRQTVFEDSARYFMFENIHCRIYWKDSFWSRISKLFWCSQAQEWQKLHLALPSQSKGSGGIGKQAFSGIRIEENVFDKEILWTGGHELKTFPDIVLTKRWGLLNAFHIK